ncbi:MAG TPA: nucleoside kinase, partial [Candidatus Fimicola cottocaccae]|nr:nucleoside kinase [Candidatus Fimicola cottocaccae]
YIEPLLFKIDSSMPEFATAERIIKFLDYFLGANPDIVPKNAIMKEFLGGSCFDV